MGKSSGIRIYADNECTDTVRWIQITAGVALLLMSVYQSGAYLVKYMSHPTLNSITWQPFAVDDVPAVTICSVPSFSPAKWQQFFNRNSGGEEFVSSPYVASMAMAELARRNFTFEQFLEAASVPVTMQVTYCALGSTDSRCDPYPDEGSKNTTSYEDLWKPRDTEFASWIPRIVEQNIGPFDDNFGLCGTLVPKVTVKPGFNRQIILNLDMGVPEMPPNESPSKKWTKWLTSGVVIPSWTVYIHDRTEVIPAYALARQIDAVEVKHSTSTQIGFDAERYTFISKAEDPCIGELDFNQAGCRQACYEQYILPCTLPGVPQENVSLIMPTSSHALPKKDPSLVCNLARSDQLDAYHAAKGKLFTRNGSDIFDEIMTSCCPKKCRKYRYMAAILSEAPLNADPSIQTYAARISIGPNNAKLHAIDDQEAYDINQFLGELGGAWGLFLGASLVNALALLVSGCQRAFAYYSEAAAVGHGNDESL